MFISRLKLRNYCNHEKLDVDFRQGLNGLLGNNGRGKSNVLDALRFAITGESINPGTKAHNLTWGKDKGSVTVEFTVGDTDYVLTRSIEATRASMKFGSQTLNKTSEIEVYLTGLLGTPMRALLDNVFIPQGKIDAILLARPTDRLREFQQSFGLDKAAEACRWLSQEVNAYPVTSGLDRQLESATTSALSAREELDRLRGEVDGKRQRMTELTPAEAVVQRALEASRTAEAIRMADAEVLRTITASKAAFDAYVKAADEARQLDTGLSSVRPQHEAAVVQLKQLEQEFALYQRASVVRSQLAAAQARLTVAAAPTEGAIAKGQAELQAVRDPLARINDILTGRAAAPKLPQHTELEQQLHQATVQVEALQRARAKTDEENELRFRAETAHRHLELVRKGKCPTCGTDFVQDLAAAEAEYQDWHTKSAALANRLNTEHATALTAAQVKQRELQAALEALTAAARQVAESEQARLRKEEAVVVARLELLTKLQTEHDAAKRQVELIEAQMAGAPAEAPDQAKIDQLRQATQLFTQMEANLRDLKVREQLADGQRANIDAAHQNAAAMRERLGQGVEAPTPAELDQAKQQLTELQLLRTAVSELNHQLGVQQALAESRESTARQLREQLAREAKDAAWVEQVRKTRDALHVSALPALMMREYVKILNARMSHYLGIWESPFQMWLDDDMAFQVRFEDGKQLDAGRLSGGQKVFASASFHLAMSDTFARKVGLLVFDEPSVHLDKDNIQHLQQLLIRLKEQSQHSGRQILIVDHQASLMQFIDHKIEV